MSDEKLEKLELEKQRVETMVLIAQALVEVREELNRAIRRVRVRV